MPLTIDLNHSTPTTQIKTLDRGRLESLDSGAAFRLSFLCNSNAQVNYECQRARNC